MLVTLLVKRPSMSPVTLPWLQMAALQTGTSMPRIARQVVSRTFSAIGFACEAAAAPRASSAARRWGRFIGVCPALNEEGPGPGDPRPRPCCAPVDAHLARRARVAAVVVEGLARCR